MNVSVKSKFDMNELKDLFDYNLDKKFDVWISIWWKNIFYVFHLIYFHTYAIDTVSSDEDLTSNE
jgi:hypothetical protein